MTTPDHQVLPSFERIATMSWRLVGVSIAVVIVFLMVMRLRLVVLPAVLALMASAILHPLVKRLRDRGVPPLVATALVLVSVITLVVAAGSWFVPQTIDQFDDLGQDLEVAVADAESWLVDGPLALDPEAIETAADSVVDAIGEISPNQVLSGALVVGEVLAGLALALVLLFFFLKDSDRILTWIAARFPDRRRSLVEDVGSQAWQTFSGYIRGTAITGLADAAGIGLGLFILGVPLLLPLMILTFFGAFFPMVGAPLAGLVAVMVAFVSGGLTDALIVLALVFAVQQLESYVLAPGIMGRAVRLHPVVVLLALTVGGITAGLIGAFLAVPVTAVAVASIAEVRRWEERQALAAEPDAG